MAVRDLALLSTLGRLRFLAKDSFVYGGAAAVNKAFALLTFPLLARHFSVADYGLIDFFTFFAALVTIALIFGQDSAIARFFYEHTEEEIRRQVISQSLALQLLLVTVLLPPIWFFSDRFKVIFPDASNTDTIFQIILCQVPFILLISFSQNLLKWTFARKEYLIVSLGSVGLNALLLVMGSFIFELTVAGVFQIALAVYIVFAMLGLYFIRQWLVRPSDFRFLLQLTPYAIPLGCICVLGALIPLIERSFVANLIGPYELGLYAAGAKVAMLMGLLVSAFQTGWGPLSLAIHKQSDASETYNFVLKAFALLVCVIVLLLSAVGDAVVNLLASDRFAGAAVVVFPLSLALAVQATSWVLEIGIGISKKTYLGLIGYVAFLASSVASIFFLAKVFGFVGVAFGVLIGRVTVAFIASYLGQRAHPLPWVYRPVIIVFSLTLVFGLVGQAVCALYKPELAAIVYVCGAAVVLGIGILVCFSQQDLGTLRGFMRND